MPDATDQSPLFLYPDPLRNISILTGAVFLYFQRQILATLPPQVVTQESFELLKLIRERQPAWADTLLRWLAAWRMTQNGFAEAADALKSFKDKRVVLAWLAYPANFQALEASKNFIESAGYSLETAYEAVDLPCACGEAVRHIFLERYLELGKDLNRLYDYCDELFRNTDEKTFLTRCYFLRLPMLQHLGGQNSGILLSNMRLLPILDAMPVEKPDNTQPSELGDVVGWELFRRIVSPRLDPLEPKTIQILQYLLEQKQNEVTRLRTRCRQIGIELASAKPESNFISLAEYALRVKVAAEIKGVLELDDSALRALIDSLLSDQKSWLAFAAFVGGLISGEVVLTAGAAAASFASLGAKAYGAAAGRREKLKTSDFALIYSLPNRELSH
jgi:hypothetical protein